MIEAADLRCAHCGAETRWDPGSKGLCCDSCGGVTPVPAPEGAPERHTLEDASRRWPGRARRPGTLHVACSSCGAVLDITRGQLTARCAFCGADAVAEAPDDGRSFPPDAVVPFEVTRAAARAACRRWAAGRGLGLKALGRRDHLSALTPIYVPFFAFDDDTHSEWEVDVGHMANVEGHDEPTWDRRVSGEENNHHRAVLAQGSTGIPPRAWRDLEPLPAATALPFDARYLAGFAAEGALVQPLEAWQAARQRLEARDRRVAESRFPEGLHRRFDIRTSHGNVSFTQVLLPMWVASYRDRGRVHRVLVDGAKGRVAGELPWSRRRVAVAAAVCALGVAGGVYAFGGAVVAAARAVMAAPEQVAPPTPPSGAQKAAAAGLAPVHRSGPIHLRSFREPPSPAKHRSP